MTSPRRPGPHQQRLPLSLHDGKRQPETLGQQPCHQRRRIDFVADGGKARDGRVGLYFEKIEAVGGDLATCLRPVTLEGFFPAAKRLGTQFLFCVCHDFAARRHFQLQ